MITITVARMAKILGVPTPDEMSERIAQTDSSNYHDAYMAAREEGDSEDEAHEKAERFEEAERAREFHTYVFQIVKVFEDEAEQLALEITPLKTKPDTYRITPKNSWTESAAKMRVAVNGISGFFFQTTKKFLESGPYTARTAVKEHLGYLGSLWELYG